MAVLATGGLQSTLENRLWPLRRLSLSFGLPSTMFSAFVSVSRVSLYVVCGDGGGGSMCLVLFEVLAEAVRWGNGGRVRESKEKQSENIDRI